MLEYHTLGRWDDITKLKRADLHFLDVPSRHLSVSFKHGKNDMYSESGNIIVAADSEEPPFCPVQLTLHYLMFLGSGYLGFLVPACDPKG